MILPVLAGIAAAFSALKNRWDLVGLNLLAAAVWIVLPDDLPGLLIALVVFAVLVVVSLGLFAEGKPGSRWETWRMEARLSVLGSWIGVALMLGFTTGVGVAFIVKADTFVGAGIMFLWAAVLARIFVPPLFKRDSVA